MSDQFDEIPHTPFITDKTVAPRGRRSKLNMQDKENLLQQYAGGETTAALADLFDIDETYIRKLASRYGVRKGQLAMPPAPRSDGSRPVKSCGHHLVAYKRARRGFDVPLSKEPQYIKLLMRGMSCQAAAGKLGLINQ